MVREAMVTPPDPNDPVVKIVNVVTLISRRGREGPHADERDCGCGRCCAEAANEAMASIKENSVRFFGGG